LLSEPAPASYQLAGGELLMCGGGYYITEA
jgi:hypothetical protein